MCLRHGQDQALPPNPERLAGCFGEPRGVKSFLQTNAHAFLLTSGLKVSRGASSIPSGGMKLGSHAAVALPAAFLALVCSGKGSWQRLGQRASVNTPRVFAPDRF